MSKVWPVVGTGSTQGPLPPVQSAVALQERDALPWQRPMRVTRMLASMPAASAALIVGRRHHRPTGYAHGAGHKPVSRPLRADPRHAALRRLSHVGDVAAGAGGSV